MNGRIWLGSKLAEGQEIDDAESQVWEILQINNGMYDSSKTKLNLQIAEQDYQSFFHSYDYRHSEIPVVSLQGIESFIFRVLEHKTRYALYWLERANPTQAFCFINFCITRLSETFLKDCKNLLKASTESIGDLSEDCNVELNKRAFKVSTIGALLFTNFKAKYFSGHPLDVHRDE